MRKGSASARLALITVVGGLSLALVSFGPVYAGKGGTHGNKNAGCNQNKPTPTHRYDANCDGSASENGNGGSTSKASGSENSNAGGNGNGKGNATPATSDGGNGKPCAGCVGKADNKHPPGQEPDENDHNKGYECDDNHGIGAQRGTGNPAHTGCRRRSSTPSPSPSTPVTPGPSSTPNPSPTKTPKVKPTVMPTVIHQCDAMENVPGIQSCADVEGNQNEAADRPQGNALPFTGGDIAGVLLAGLGLIAGGGFLILRRPR